MFEICSSIGYHFNVRIDIFHLDENSLIFFKHVDLIRFFVWGEFEGNGSGKLKVLEHSSSMIDFFVSVLEFISHFPECS